MNSFLATLFGSSSPRQDSAPTASEQTTSLADTDAPNHDVQRVLSGELQSPSVQEFPTNRLLATLFFSFSPRQDSAPASENEKNTFHAPRRVGIGAGSLVIPAKLEGLGLGRRMSGLTPRTPRFDVGEEDYHSPRGASNSHEKEKDQNKDDGKKVLSVAAVNSTQVSNAQPLEERLAKFRATIAETKLPVSTTAVHPPSTATTVIPEVISSKEAEKTPHFSSTQAIEDRLARFRASVANKPPAVSVVSNVGSGSVVRQPGQGIEERIQNYKKTVETLTTRNAPTTKILTPPQVHTMDAVRSGPTGSILSSLFHSSVKTDDDDTDMLSFDTAVSMSSTHPAPRLLAQLFDADNDDVLQDPEPYRRPTPALPTAAALPLVASPSKPTTPIWLEPEQPTRPRVDEQNSVKSNSSSHHIHKSPVAPYVPSMKVANNHDASPQTSKPATPLVAQGRAVPLHPRPSRVPHALAGGGGGGGVASTATAQAQPSAAATTQATATEQDVVKKSRLPRRRPI